MNSIKIYDTTLRDGSQAEGISFTVEDKIRIAQKPVSYTHLTLPTKA